MSMRDNSKMLVAGIAATWGIFASLATTAHADSVPISSLVSASSAGLGTFGGTLDYYVDAGGVGVLTVSLTNYSPPALGGYLTGFAFNFASSDPLAVAILQPGANYPFASFSGNAPPFGHFKAGAALGGSWTGGGNPAAGIPVGATGTFVFSIVASDANFLSAADFISGPNAYDFVVRFRGFMNGQSDKVPGVIVCPCDLNHDGIVNYGDVQVVLDAWGPNPGSIADVNGDGIVDQLDLGLVLKCWLDCD